MTAPKLAREARPGEPGFPGGRVYVRPSTGRAVRSVTAALRVLDKPGLKYWAARECAEYAATNIDTLSQMERDEVIRLVKKAPFGKKDELTPAQIGDLVHNAVDDYIKTGNDDPDMTDWPTTAVRMWNEFLHGFVAKYKPEWVASEFTVWSEKYGYAGSCDWAAKIGKWLVYGDHKTGKRVYPEVGLQVAALANAEFIINDDGSERPNLTPQRHCVLHIRPTFTRLHILRRPDENFQAFTDCLSLSNWKDSADDIIQDAEKIQSKNFSDA